MSNGPLEFGPRLLPGDDKELIAGANGVEIVSAEDIQNASVDQRTELQRLMYFMEGKNFVNECNQSYPHLIGSLFQNGVTEKSLMVLLGRAKEQVYLVEAFSMLLSLSTYPGFSNVRQVVSVIAYTDEAPLNKKNARHALTLIGDMPANVLVAAEAKKNKRPPTAEEMLRD